jgi:LuxR family maltose regulon positive regulatory protein
MGKVSRPILTGVFPRKRLFGLLDRMRRQPVVWVSGPAGCGKTTLLSSYLEARGIPCLWYQLDEGDSDPATFFYYLGVAAKRASPGKRKALPLFTTEYRQGIPTFTLRYFEDLYRRLKIPSAVVFDNYQEVPDESPFHSMILDGLSQIPEGINVILVSRKDPPPVFIRLQANHLMDILGWNELRLTLEESGGIVRFRAKLKWSKEWIGQLHRTTDGWAAGMVLMVEKAKRERIEPPMVGKLAPEEIFKYFSNEIFEKIDEESQDFLLKTSFVPKMTSRMAEDLTGFTHAGRILSTLSRDNFFTVKSFHPEPIYQYHPLFRDFLLARARETFPPPTLSNLLRRAAKLLEDGGQVEAANSILHEVGDWEEMARLILKQAPLMLEQGRNRPLEEWLSCLPKDLMENNPWLLYWMGACRFPYEPSQSEIYFERCFEKFEARKEAAGIILALWGIVESIISNAADFKRLDRWISIIEKLDHRFKAFPSLEAELRFTSTMLAALLYRQPQHPGFETWAERALSLSESSSFTDLRMQILSRLSLYRFHINDFGKARVALESLQKLTQSSAATPLTQIVSKNAEAAYYRFTGLHEKCVKATNEGLEISSKTGVKVLDRLLLNHGISSALNVNDDMSAGKLLEKMALSLEVSNPWYTAMYHMNRTREALLRGEVGQASVHADLALKLNTEVGNSYTLGWAYVAGAQAKHGLGKKREAEDHLKHVFDIARKIDNQNYEFSALLLEALFAFDRKDEEAGGTSLQKALTLGRERGFFYAAVDLPGGMARLCTRAFEAKMEVEYVHELIRRLNIAPDPPPCHLENWPWPIKVFTLGRFELIKEGNQIRFSRKVQQKPLSMLKALIAFGGKDVGEGQIIDALWPEAEGDAAHQLFETTLHRLRQLIAPHEAVQRREGRLTLNQKHCWVDVWAFERLIDQAEDAWRKEPGATGADDVVLRTQKAIDAYRGIFLPGEAQELWTNSLRECLRSKFLRCVEKLGRHWQKSGHYDNAVECFQKGLDPDDIIEEFYQALMLLYQRMSRRAEALSVYLRCQRTLSSSLGVEPSPQTEAIRKSILAEKKA